MEVCCLEIFTLSLGVVFIYNHLIYLFVLDMRITWENIWYIFTTNFHRDFQKCLILTSVHFVMYQVKDKLQIRWCFSFGKLWVSKLKKLWKIEKKNKDLLSIEIWSIISIYFGIRYRQFSINKQNFI